MIQLTMYRFCLNSDEFDIIIHVGYLVTTFLCLTPVHQYKSVERETFELSDKSANTNAITKLELVYLFTNGPYTVIAVHYSPIMIGLHKCFTFYFR